MIGPIIDIIGKFIPDKTEAMKAAQELEKTTRAAIEGEAKIRIKEIESGGFRAFVRPFCFFGLTLVILLYFLMGWFIPYCVVLFDLNIYTMQVPDLPSELWYAFTACVIGLGALRSLDKRR